MAPDRLSTRRARRASITLVVLCMSTALGIAIGSYVALCTRSTQFSARMLQREKARELAQVGLEEALWALNQNNWAASGPDGNAVWTTVGANRTVTLTYPMTGQDVTGQVALTVANYASTGPTWPTISANATITLASGDTTTRTLQASTAPAPLFGNAIASSESYVSFTAGGTVDSWNSDPDNNPATPAVAYSFTAGAAANYDAVVAGCTNGTYGVVLTQATVRGYVATFGLPVSYSTSGSPPGKVLGPSTAAATNVDTTRLGKSAFVPLANVFSVTLPSTSGPNFGGLLNNLLTLVSTLLALPAGTDTLEFNGTLTINGTPLLAPNLVISSPTKLIIDGDLAIAQGLLTTGKITITSTGSLELFVTGDLTIGGDGFDNQTNDPKKLAIYCTGGSTTDSVEYNTTRSFCGVIFCENKPIDIKQNATFSGALLSREFVRFSGSATAPVFHYDTALRQTRFSAVATPYVLQQVTEL